MTPPAHSAAPAWSSLTGKRILDLSRLLPGPYATSLLADLGADVIKVESPHAGDPLRIAPDLFDALNRNKRSIALDLRDEDDRNTFLDLVRTADAVVESFRPGVLDGMGLGYATLHEANPRLVLCSLSGYGQSGPYAQKPGHELNFLGLSGFFAVPGRLDGHITRPGVRIGDMAGAMHAALALTAALGAETEGQHIDVSLSESITAWCSLFALPLRDVPDPLEAGLVQGDNDTFTTADGRRLSLAARAWVSRRTRSPRSWSRAGTSASSGPRSSPPTNGASVVPRPPTSSAGPPSAPSVKPHSYWASRRARSVTRSTTTPSGKGPRTPRPTSASPWSGWAHIYARSPTTFPTTSGAATS
ncbi:CoA transferase [Streptomyces sp. NBC_00984]|uniref:CoA transferase n=1 Tax=Streptomyces sp. NBC_00984 TaxID=2903700 RepID=UPI00386ADF9F|nr:CoA transferase [Streptomyces sp. NBC_00984]